MNHWYVITGGPCAGKTTLIEELGRRGYPTVPEAARAHIEAGFSAGKTLEEIRRNEVAFQHELIDIKRETERTLPTSEVVFFDRAMHDSIAYLAMAGVFDDPHLRDALAGSTYRKAFLLELLPFHQDGARTEDEASAKRVHDLLCSAYTDAGIPVVRVPVMPVSERADLVLKNL